MVFIFNSLSDRLLLLLEGIERRALARCTCCWPLFLLLKLDFKRKCDYVLTHYIISRNVFKKITISHYTVTCIQGWRYVPQKAPQGAVIENYPKDLFVFATTSPASSVLGDSIIYSWGGGLQRLAQLAPGSSPVCIIFPYLGRQWGSFTIKRSMFAWLPMKILFIVIYHRDSRWLNECIFNRPRNFHA